MNGLWASMPFSKIIDFENKKVSLGTFSKRFRSHFIFYCR